MTWNWKRSVWAGASVAAAGLLGALYALLHTPSWYDIPVIAPERRQDVRNNLLAAEQAFTENLLTSNAPFIYHVYQEDVNRWIAMRRDIYPLIDELAPPELIDPMVLFDKGEITIAGRYRKAGMDVVVSVDVSVAFSANTITLTVAGLRCGSVRVPPSFVSIGLNRRIHRPAEATWPGSPAMSGDFATGLHIDSKAWWKNGGMEYQVRDVGVLPGRLDLTIQPLGHHSAKSRKDQP